MRTATGVAGVVAGGYSVSRLVRPIAGNPVTMGEMTRHVADAGSYAPVTILIQQMPATAETFPDTHQLAVDPAAAVMAIEQVGQSPKAACRPV
jgi:hypothetical protein